MSEWAHSPNAKVIDELVADFTARPQVWAGVRGAVSVASQATAWSAVPTLIYASAWEEDQLAIWSAVLALFTWPSSADLLSLSPDALRTIIDTCDGGVKHQAVLLPAVIARSTT